MRTRFLVALFGLLGSGCFLAPGLTSGDAGGPMDAQLGTDAGRSDGGADVDSAVVDSGEPPADAVTPPAPDTGPPDTQDAGPPALDAGPPAVDAGPDAGSDAGTDAGPDAGSDAGTDAGPDAGSDAGSDAGPDAGLPSCDAEYGGTQGYSLCTESSDRCEFYFNPSGAGRASCNSICGSTNCIATYDNSGTCGRWYESRCDVRFLNAICVCGRPRL